MNPDQQQSNNHHQPRERSIPITTQGGGVTTTHFPLSSSSTHPATSSSPFSNSPGRSGGGGNLFNQLHQFRKNQHADEMFSDRNHFPSFSYPSMSPASRNVGDFFSHSHRDGEESESDTHQPRVYNIPIQVETPEGVVPLSRSNSHSPGPSQFRNHGYHAEPTHGGGPMPEKIGETFSRQRPGPSPTPPPKPRFTPTYKPEPQGYNTHQQPYHQEAQQQQHRVHNIPVQIERGSKPRDFSHSDDSKQNVPGSDQRSSFDQNFGRDSPRPESQQSGGGPHVINIPVNNERCHQRENLQQSSQPVPNQSKFTGETPKGPTDPLDLVKGIRDEASRWESEVNVFDGESQKQYRFLDEMLTRCMLKLDNIDSGGRDDVRSARKSTLSYVDRVIASLESKINKKNENQGQEEAPQTVESNLQQFPEIGSSMEVESGEADSTEQHEPADDNPNTESSEPDSSSKQQSSELESQMEVASSSNSNQPKETSTDLPEDEQEDDGNDEEAIDEGEDPSGVDGSSKDFYNCSNDQVSNENICRTRETIIIEEMDKEESAEEPPIKVNQSNGYDDKVNIKFGSMLESKFDEDDGMDMVNEPKIELPPDDHDDDLMDNDARRMFIETDDSNDSTEIVDIEPLVEMPDENSISSKDSDEMVRESIRIVEESSNIQSSPTKPVHA